MLRKRMANPWRNYFMKGGNGHAHGNMHCEQALLSVTETFEHSSALHGNKACTHRKPLTEHMRGRRMVVGEMQ